MSEKREASAEERQALADAIRRGGVIVPSEAVESLRAINLKKPDFTLTGAQFSFWGPRDGEGGGMGIEWQTRSAGFGRCDFYLDGSGQLRCMNEAMGKQFLRTLLERLLEEAVLDD